ncbi:MAG TPA: S-adenosylmethionine:tRNA ribosyltransferase-isomerase, partial [Thermodesulfovibrionales bacterium]|nr:S-adenosylmethionine:tRNA ribosyltransferase-isomerase [Thermodesulfovibrionales bacterium]
MKATEFDFHLPESFIALTPVTPRDACRLLVLERENGAISHRIFRDLPEFLSAGDLLLLNNTKVFPARLFGTKETGGKIEILLVKEREPDVWEVLSRGKYTGSVRVSDELSGEMYEGYILRLTAVGSSSSADAIGKAGLMPLPPYIKRMPSEADREWYQTIYAEHTGSIASPTAGLHFTEDLIGEIGKKGVIIRSLTLHVGPGTFKPMRTENIEEHAMDGEYFEIESGLVEIVKRVKRAGRRVFTVGTTTTRAIEGYISGRWSADHFCESTRSFRFSGREGREKAEGVRGGDSSPVKGH